MTTGNQQQQNNGSVGANNYNNHNSNNNSIILNPLSYDIKCGQNKTLNDHIGNQIYRDKIAVMAPLYNNAPNKSEKMQISIQFIREIKEQYDSRFLRLINPSQPQLGWIQLNDREIRDKVTHALRFHGQQQPSSSSTTTATAPNTQSPRKTKSNGTVASLTNTHEQRDTTTTITNTITFETEDDNEDIDEETDQLYRKQQILYMKMKGEM